jgi:hypothetical protein
MNHENEKIQNDSDFKPSRFIQKYQQDLSKLK